MQVLPEDGSRVYYDDSSPNSKEAIEVLIRSAEERVGHTLPKSYKDFIFATGGEGWYSEAEGHDLLLERRSSVRRTIFGVADSGLYSSIDPENYRRWVEGVPEIKIPDDVYYRYGYVADPASAQIATSFRQEYLLHLIKIGGMGQGDSVLLNPLEVSVDGEMEAWLLSFQVFAVRYRSFAELMQEMAFRDVLDNGRFFLRGDEVNKVSCVSLLKTAIN